MTLTLTYSGESTYSTDEFDILQDALAGLTESHNDESRPITVPSGALRWRDGGLWVSITLSVETEPANLDTNRTTLAEQIVAVGFEETLADAEDAIEVES